LTINQTCILQKKNTLKEIESIFNLSWKITFYFYLLNVSVNSNNSFN
jgi:hypothetical protein